MSGALIALSSTAVTTGALLLALWGLGRLVYLLGLAPISRALGRLPSPGIWLGYLLLLPGTVLHECSHAAACLCTGTRIRRFVPFHPQSDGTLGWVEHDQVGPARSALIGLAPLVGGVAALTLSARVLLPDLPAGPTAWTDPAPALWALPGWAWHLILAADPTRPATWLFVYLALSIGRAAAPSLPDLRQVAGVWAAIAGVLFLVTLVVQITGSADGSWAAGATGQIAGWVARLNGALAFAVALVLAATVALLPLALVASAVARPDRRPATRPARRRSRRAS